MNRSIRAYDRKERAESYHRAQGFDPKRKSAMLDVAVACLRRLLPANARLLELGAGSGLFTRRLLEIARIRLLVASDGAAEMLKIAESEIKDPRVSFRLLDFTVPVWPKDLGRFDAVTSSMAIHHAREKRALFSQVHASLAPGGLFVFADHMAGAHPLVSDLLAIERASLRGIIEEDKAAVLAWRSQDDKSQRKEGNVCESVGQYLTYLEAAGFKAADVIWRDHWLAVFVAVKKVRRAPKPTAAGGVVGS